MQNITGEKQNQDHPQDNQSSVCICNWIFVYILYYSVVVAVFRLFFPSSLFSRAVSAAIVATTTLLYILSTHQRAY